MKNTILQIEASNAVKAYESAPPKFRPVLENLFGKNVFAKNIRERLQSFDDVLEYHGHTQESFAKWCEGLRPHEIGNRKEELIVAAYNEGKIADWRDGTPKRYPIFNMPDPSGAGFAYYDYVRWYSASVVGARLVFIGPESLENLKDAVEKFLPEYKESRTL
ncbi:hypothetical protein ASG38_15075 [Flavobacterium sp. Leaf359]|uniref:hypothetical protein n=1 Tax=Flavobacterium sp. Leaf359 TaxID=1736351 RepID=UPI0007015ABC|nr:hypothetical protein [Flavobacterium sp. Leaf359]KQS45929.1 hypothetical protein ASG38_15075 [Flavobacterium sp. Leaf359]